MIHVAPTDFEAATTVPDPADLVGFTYAKPVELIRDAVRKTHTENVEFQGQNGLLSQYLDRNDLDREGDALSYIVNVQPEIHASETRKVTPIEVLQIRKDRRGPGRPQKRGRPRQKGPDKRLKAMSGPLRPAERRDILDAVDYATDLDRPLNTTINLHPSLLDDYPDDELREWFRKGPWKKLGEFFARRRDDDGRPLGWFAFATTENYDGQRRQHYHLVCYCPDCARDDMEAMLRRTYSGEGAVDVGDLKEDGITYRVKQCGGDAVGPPRPGRPTPEKCSRYDGAPVAPVLGKRYSISRSIDLAARTHAGWQHDRDEWRAARRDHSKAKRREIDDHAMPSTLIHMPAAMHMGDAR